MRYQGSHYEVLGIDFTATQEEVRRAFRVKALSTHPDKLKPTASEAEKRAAEDRFHLITLANEVLSDPAKRRNYDNRLNTQPTRSQSVYDNQARRNKDREEWLRQQEAEHQVRMETIRKNGGDLRAYIQRALSDAKQQTTVLERMLSEMETLPPEWRARKEAVEQRKAERLYTTYRRSNTSP